MIAGKGSLCTGAVSCANTVGHGTYFAEDTNILASQQPKTNLPNVRENFLRQQKYCQHVAPFSYCCSQLQKIIQAKKFGCLFLFFGLALIQWYHFYIHVHLFLKPALFGMALFLFYFVGHSYSYIYTNTNLKNSLYSHLIH